MHPPVGTRGPKWPACAASVPVKARQRPLWDARDPRRPLDNASTLHLQYLHCTAPHHLHALTARAAPAGTADTAPMLLQRPALVLQIMGSRVCVCELCVLCVCHLFPLARDWAGHLEAQVAGV